MAVSCKVCGKQFDSFRGLNGHMNAHLIKRAEESFEAPKTTAKTLDIFSQGKNNAEKIDYLWGGKIKFTNAQRKKNEHYYLQLYMSDDLKDDSGTIFVGAETNQGWMRVHSKEWKTKRTPISYNSATKTITFLTYANDSGRIKLNKAVDFAKAKAIIDSYNKQWDLIEASKKKAPAKKKAKPNSLRSAATRGGRKAPTISATKRKVGTRMRGNDGKMWQVKKSGKSQRWMAGAEPGWVSEGEERHTCYICGYSEEELEGIAVMMKTIGGDMCKPCATDYGYDYREMTSLRAETFEAGGWKVTCSKCGVSGHNKATCGKKSKPQYVRKTVKKEDVRKNEFLKATGAILIGVIMGRFL